MELESTSCRNDLKKSPHDFSLLHYLLTFVFKADFYFLKIWLSKWITIIEYKGKGGSSKNALL